MKIDDNIYQDLCEYWGGKASVSQVKRIEAWLEENPMHKDCFEQYYQLFCQVNYAVKYDKVDLSRAKGEVLSLFEQEEKANLQSLSCLVGECCRMFVGGGYFVFETGAERCFSRFDTASDHGGTGKCDFGFGKWS